MLKTIKIIRERKIFSYLTIFFDSFGYFSAFNKNVIDILIQFIQKRAAKLRDSAYLL